MAFDGQGASNGNAPLTKHGGPRGFSALDVVVQGGFLPLGSGPVEFGNWLLGPSLTIAANLTANVTLIVNTVIASAVTAAVATATASATASATAAATSATTASTGATTATTEAGLATTAAAAAAASATSFLTNIATTTELWTGTNNVHFHTSKVLADAAAFQVAVAGEISGATVTFDHTKGFNRSYTLTANTTFAKPTNLKDGVTYSYLFIQDATGGRTHTMNAFFVPGSIAFAFITSANAYNILTGTYNAALDKLIGCTVWKSA